MNLNQQSIHDFITRQLDLLRYEKTVRAEVFSLLDTLHTQLAEKLTHPNIQTVIDGVERVVQDGFALILRVLDVLPVLNAEFLWLSGWLAGLAAAYRLKGKIVPIGKKAARKMAQSFHLGGLTLPESVAKQRDDLVLKLKSLIRHAAIDEVKLTFDDLVDTFNRAKQYAKTLSKTWINAVQQTAHEAFGRVNPLIKGYRHLSVLDGATSSVCTWRHGKLWNKKHEPIGHDELFKRPPLHPNCRSQMVYVFDLDDAFDGITGEDWVKSRSLKQLQEQFGVGIGQMLYDGKIALRDAVDGLKPVSLKDLYEKKQVIDLQAWMGKRRYHIILNDLKDANIQQQIKQYGLTEAESVVLRYYTGAGYRELNGFLRGKFQALDLSHVVEVMKSALNKLPDYQGIVVRRDHLPDTELAKHQLGNVVQYPSFTSATFGKTDVMIEAKQNHRLKIYSKHAKRIDWISEIPEELEVLFTASTRFEVQNIPQLIDGVLEIRLDELP